MNVQEVADGFVDHHSEIKPISKLPDPLQVWCLKQWISWKFAEECQELLAILTTLFKVIQLSLRRMAIKDTAGPKLLEDLKRVYIRESMEA